MGDLLSNISSCVWWALMGGVLGLLLGVLLCKCLFKCKCPTTCNCLPTCKCNCKTSQPEPESAPVDATTHTLQSTPSVAAPLSAVSTSSSTQIDLAAAKAAGFSMKHTDDLTVIEGIGPKINEIFKSAGLITLADVAKASVPEMRKILDDGGSRFRIANPATWAQQANLAANNQWSALKELQDELSGGLKK